MPFEVFMLVCQRSRSCGLGKFSLDNLYFLRFGLYRYLSRFLEKKSIYFVFINIWCFFFALSNIILSHHFVFKMIITAS